MDYLQYPQILFFVSHLLFRFKPCYKWITFNTYLDMFVYRIILLGFKPCYKWITFNTDKILEVMQEEADRIVLNLVINGLPSILEEEEVKISDLRSFKPCYKWITFNTVHE